MWRAVFMGGRLEAGVSLSVWCEGWEVSSGRKCHIMWGGVCGVFVQTGWRTAAIAVVL